MTSLDAVKAAHPDWTIRRDAGQDWTCWTAQRAQVITAPTLDELAAKLDKTGAPAGIASDPRVTRARELAAEHHQPLAMTPGDVRHLLARWQRSGTELLDLLAEITGS